MVCDIDRIPLHYSGGGHGTQLRKKLAGPDSDVGRPKIDGRGKPMLSYAAVAVFGLRQL